MTFIRRFTTNPGAAVIAEIEGIVVIDNTPPAAVLGVGTNAVLVLAEFEDGPFATGDDAPELFTTDRGIVQIFNSGQVGTPGAEFGGFGYTYGTSQFQNACARAHLAELWNGNAFIHLKYISAPKMMFGRVDSSVGKVAFSPLAAILAGAGPYILAVGQTLAITTETGGPTSSTAIAAVVATVTGSGGTFPTLFAGGETISIQVDHGVVVNVVFSAADQSGAQVAARINAALGYAAASFSSQLTIVGLQKGTGGQLVLANVAGTPLATLGLTAGTTAGTGNVANLSAVTATEVATIINGTAGLTAINAHARVAADGSLHIYSSTGGTGTINITAGAMATALGVAITGTTVKAGEHPADFIPAGTRVSDGTTVWVTMQTLAIVAGSNASPNVGPHVVKVRPALDNGTAVGATAGTVTTATDQPLTFDVKVTNPAALSVALTEAQLDLAYINVLSKSLDPLQPSKNASYIVSARRSPAVVANTRINVITASANGLLSRKACVSAPLGFSTAQAIADVALYRSDRLFYTHLGLKESVPEIAAIGAAAGGIGFNDTGILTVRADFALAMVCATIPPEDNPGEPLDGLMDGFFAVDAFGASVGIGDYIAFKAAGICAPQLDDVNGMGFQSGVTSDLTPGRTTIARRKMADFLEDETAAIAAKYSKRLATDFREKAFMGDLTQFLEQLLSKADPSKQRIFGYSPITVDNTLRQSGITTFNETVTTLASLDDIVINAQIGEGVVSVTTL